MVYARVCTHCFTKYQMHAGSSQVIAQYYQLIRLGFEVIRSTKRPNCFLTHSLLLGKIHRETRNVTSHTFYLINLAYNFVNPNNLIEMCL